MKKMSKAVENKNKRGKNMKAGINASQVLADMKREEYFKNRVKRNVCIIDSKKQCDKCNYQSICENVEVNNEI